MVNKELSQNTDFFAYEDNFKKKESIQSICIYNNRAVDSLVTIGIPTYRRAATLKDSIESAIAQVCDFHYEIIIVDNNPERNDETEVLMNEYKSHPHVSYYKNALNLGMGGNWNRIVELSRTPWVAFLHDDDMIAPSFLKDMINVAKEYNADVVNSGFLFWFENKEEKPQFEFNKTRYPVIRSTLGANFFSNRAGMPTGILCKREVYINEGGVNDAYYPSIDWVFSSNLSEKCTFLLYEKKLTIYRYSMNAMRKKETLEAYIPVNYFFTLYVGNRLDYPKWFVNVYSKMETRFFVSKLGGKRYNLNGMAFKPASFLGKSFYLLIVMIARRYFDRKDLI